MIAVMQGHCSSVHVTRAESRELGYIDALHWGFRLRTAGHRSTSGQ